MRDKSAQLLDGCDVQQLRADLNAIENPKDWLYILLGLAEFMTPKLQRTALVADEGLRLTGIQVVDFDGSSLAHSEL